MDHGLEDCRHAARRVFPLTALIGYYGLNEGSSYKLRGHGKKLICYIVDKKSNKIWTLYQCFESQFRKLYVFLNRVKFNLESSHEHFVTMDNRQPSVAHPAFSPLFLSSPGADPTSYFAKMSSVNSEFALARMMATLTQHKQHFFNALYRDRDRDESSQSSSQLPDNFQRQIMNSGELS